MHPSHLDQSATSKQTIAATKRNNYHMIMMEHVHVARYPCFTRFTTGTTCFTWRPAHLAHKSWVVPHESESHYVPRDPRLSGDGKHSGWYLQWVICWKLLVLAPSKLQISDILFTYMCPGYWYTCNWHTLRVYFQVLGIWSFPYLVWTKIRKQTDHLKHTWETDRLCP